jgi:hypothetical protein
VATKENHENIHQVIRPPNLVTNLGPPEHEVLTTRHNEKTEGQVVVAYLKPLYKTLKPHSQTEHIDYVVETPTDVGTGHGRVYCQFIFHYEPPAGLGRLEYTRLIRQLKK